MIKPRKPEEIDEKRVSTAKLVLLLIVSLGREIVENARKTGETTSAEAVAILKQLFSLFLDNEDALKTPSETRRKISQLTSAEFGQLYEFAEKELGIPHEVIRAKWEAIVDIAYGILAQLRRVSVLYGGIEEAYNKFIARELNKPAGVPYSTEVTEGEGDKAKKVRKPKPFPGAKLGPMLQANKVTPAGAAFKEKHKPAPDAPKP